MLMLIAQMKVKEKVSFWPLSEKPKWVRARVGEKEVSFSSLS